VFLTRLHVKKVGAAPAATFIHSIAKTFKERKIFNSGVNATAVQPTLLIIFAIIFEKVYQGPRGRCIRDPEEGVSGTQRKLFDEKNRGRELVAGTL
jgi:hypothetical protein